MAGPFSTEIFREQALQLARSARWAAVVLPLGIVVGTAVAAFLWSLDQATALRLSHPWLIWLLPLAGGGIGWLSATVGRSVDAGNNLILEEIHEPGGGVPLRMAPLILITTVLTHLCGGSAGREGTAVQIGGGLAGGFARWIPGLERDDVPALLMAGVAAGFGGVFGTPVAGMVFALEVLAIGRMRYAAILPCLAAALAADTTCTAWGIVHTPYRVASLKAEGSAGFAHLDLQLLAAAAAAGAIFGLAGQLFAAAIHGVQQLFRRHVPRPVLRPVLGGMIVVALALLFDTRDYLGLGVTNPDPHAVTILSAFEPGGARPGSWLAKILFTAVTIGSGFKGGEVTPLFYVGATLGNTLAAVAGLPADLFAALGFVAVFAGAANTPLACTVMAAELFGGAGIAYFAVACVLAYLTSGLEGIYRAQRLDTPKRRRPAGPSTR